jgi:hypothetical protein
MKKKTYKCIRAEGLSAKMETYANCAIFNVFARFYTNFERKFTEIARFFAVFDRVKNKSSGLSVHKPLFYVARMELWNQPIRQAQGEK